MLDNYDEETKPLFKLLKTEAFRFVIVRYNHFSFVQQLEIDFMDLESLVPSKVGVINSCVGTWWFYYLLL